MKIQEASSQTLNSDSQKKKYFWLDYHYGRNPIEVPCSEAKASEFATSLRKLIDINDQSSKRL
jgi:hypothetical protein